MRVGTRQLITCFRHELFSVHAPPMLESNVSYRFIVTSIIKWLFGWLRHDHAVKPALRQIVPRQERFQKKIENTTFQISTNF